MSLRPSLSGFSLKKLTSMFGCGDEDLISELCKALDKYINDDAQREKGRKLIRLIVIKGYNQNLPERETELLVIVFYCMTHFGQQHDFSESTFWETFMNDIHNGKITADSDIQPLLKFLLKGRPLLGLSIKSNWSYYAFLSNKEASQLLTFLTNSEQFQDEYDFRSAIEWMQRVVRQEQDIWYFAS